MAWLGDHWLDLFGWGGSALLIFSLLQTRVLRFRLLNLAASLSLVRLQRAGRGLADGRHERRHASINLWFIARMLRERHDEAAFDVLQVGPARRLPPPLPARCTATDIGRYQPGFAATTSTTTTSRSRSRRATRPSASC